MKYIKTYEEIKEYTSGDYVYLNLEQIKVKYSHIEIEDPIAIIIRKILIKKEVKKEIMDDYVINVFLNPIHNPIHNNPIHITVKKNCILRLATPEEISDYKSRHLKYKNEDFVVLNIENLISNYKNEPFEPHLKNISPIQQIYSSLNHFEKPSGYITTPYYIEPEFKLYTPFYLREREILRLATPEEIKKYKLEKSMRQFNL